MPCRGPEPTGVCVKCGKDGIHVDFLQEDGVCSTCTIASLSSGTLSIITNRVEEIFFDRLLWKKWGIFEPWNHEESKELIHELRCRVQGACRSVVDEATNLTKSQRK